MTEATNSTGAKRPKRALFRQLRSIMSFLNNFDFEEMVTFISRIEKNQSKIEQNQSKEAADRQRFSEEMSAWRQEIGRNVRSESACLLNVKNLGYELGRILAERDLQRTVTQPGPTKLRSKLCVQADFATDWLSFWCQELLTAPYYHRKVWELCYICQVLFSEAKLSTGRRGLGFGCGEEPLPSVFAKYGVHVTATDLDQSRPEAEVWRLTHQHAAGTESFRRRDICPDEDRLATIEFRPVDMNSIPHDFDSKFDFCWSTCALEHLGSLAHGLAFVEASLRTLKPGGIAVHTTEFTLDEGETIDNYPTVLYQAHHLVEFSRQLQHKGYDVVPFDFSAGSGVLDRFVDVPPWTHELYIPPQHHAHLKLSIDGYTCTSVGMIIRNPPNRVEHR